MIFLGQVPDEDVQRDVVFGEARCHFDGEKHVGVMRDAQRALERVVVADRDERHARAPARLGGCAQGSVYDSPSWARRSAKFPLSVE